ncbi:MAG: VanW family protein, partial [bacterium]|nr:VanW family protein [bacterium]
MFLSSVLILGLFNIDKIISGLKAADVKIGGRDQKSALEMLREAEMNFLEQKINFLFQDRVWTIKLKNLGIEFFPEKTIEKARRLGREKNPILAVKNQIAARLNFLKIESDFEIKQDIFEETLKEKFFMIEKPAQNATLIYNKNKNDFDATQSAEGVIINRIALKGDLERQIVRLRPEDIELSLVRDIPAVLEGGADETKKKALAILASAPFVLKFEDKEFKIQKDDLLEIFEFKPVDSAGKKNLDLTISRQKLAAFLTALAPAINRSPINAQLSVKDGRAVIFQIAEDGLKLAVDENIEPVSRSIFEQKKEIELIIEKEKPAITQDSIENLGIIHFLSAGVSNFSGSSAARINNIRISANKFHGVIIAPDEEFSFNTILGDIGAEQGYLPGLVIQANKTIPEYGGGICQVSTTMFRAAINAGLKITERFPHAFPVAFYNPQ